MDYVAKQPILIGMLPNNVTVYVRRDVRAIILGTPGSADAVFANVNHPYLRGTAILDAALAVLDGKTP